MKKIIIIISVLLTANWAKAQEIPPYFKIDCSLFKENALSWVIDYRLQVSFCRKGLTEYTRNDGKNIENDASYQADSMTLYAGMFVSRELKGNIQKLSITQLSTNQVMDIYLRFCYSPEHGEWIFIKGLSFVKGDFFYDMCQSKEKYAVPCLDYSRDIPLNRSEKILLIGNLRQHAVKRKVLNKLIVTKNCN